MAQKRVVIVVAALVMGAVVDFGSSRGQERRTVNAAAEPPKKEEPRELAPAGAAAVGGEGKSPDGPSPAGAEKVRLSAVRFLSSKSYTRVTLDLSQAASFEARRLREDAAKGLLPRIYIDIFGAQLAMDAKEPVKVDDGLLRQVRVGQFSQQEHHSQYE